MHYLALRRILYSTSASYDYLTSYLDSKKFFVWGEWDVGSGSRCSRYTAGLPIKFCNLCAEHGRVCTIPHANIRASFVHAVDYIRRVTPALGTQVLARWARLIGADVSGVLPEVEA